uniref:Uncharacterized protein n=1 Tax=Neogobius melanostomus TaxID=47308 RepID=A0A8C6SGR3_9GOBI
MSVFREKRKAHANLWNYKILNSAAIMNKSTLNNCLVSNETAAFGPDAHQIHHLDHHNKLTPPGPQPCQDGAERCGSLHLSSSPDSSGADRLVHWGVVGVEGAELLYGHYHGLGDTAEDLTDHTSSGQGYKLAPLHTVEINGKMSYSLHGVWE